LKVLVCGYGLIGKDRVAALLALQAEGLPLRAIALLDPYLADGASLPAGVERLAAWEAVAAFAPDWVVVATPHDVAVGLAARALDLGAKVLLEKPLGRSLAEAQALVDKAQGRLWVGYNYRFFAGVAALFADAQAGRFGRLVSAHFTLGHGGSPDLLGSWKMDAAKVGGGCLLDPGSHLFDLCLALSPSGVTAVSGLAWRGFWDRGFDEDAQVLLKADGYAITLDCSLVRWRSAFRLELQGSEGYGVVSGRGRSYGPQTYRRGVRWGWQKAKSQADSEELVLETDCMDSFKMELKALLDPGFKPVLAPCGGAEALRGMRVYQQALDVTQSGSHA
jgi:predicted dehydrogenase